MGNAAGTMGTEGPFGRCYSAGVPPLRFCLESITFRYGILE